MSEGQCADLGDNETLEVMYDAWSMDIDRASLVTSLILLPGVFAAPLGGYMSDHYFKGRRKPLIIIGLGVLAGSCFVIAYGIGIVIGVVVLSVVGLMLIMPDIMLASFPSDRLCLRATIPCSEMALPIAPHILLR